MKKAIIALLIAVPLTASAATAWAPATAKYKAKHAVKMVKQGEKDLKVINETGDAQGLFQHISTPFAHELRGWSTQRTELNNPHAEKFAACQFALLDFQFYSRTYTQADGINTRRRREQLRTDYRRNLKECKALISKKSASPAPKTEAVSQRADFDSIKRAAMSGDYQAQRNLAFGYVSYPYKGQDMNPILGCAWYKTIIMTGSVKVNVTDTNNVEVYCNKLPQTQKEAAKYQAGELLKKIGR